MIGRIESYLRRLRRRFSRSECTLRLLGLTRSTGTATAPGLIMIQIDGLSYTQLQRALERGEMPFLKRLITREHYQLHRHYSGLPASTPAVQGELFYGVKNAVPAFSFMDRKSGRIRRMIEPSAAANIERELAARGGKPLLDGGSAYADIFTGGAAESHFCPSSLGWGPALRAANPFVIGFLILSNGYSFVRTLLLLGLELVLALVDFVRGQFAGNDLLKELQFVPTRIVISVLLRELVTIGVKMDIARGLPVVHLNFLGYDEQSHRRGPSSKFAHWTLKGIDDAIARIWRSAQRSARRQYEVWVYSDHGQEETIAYSKLYGRSLTEAVAEIFTRLEGRNEGVHADDLKGIQLLRARLLGGKRIQSLFSLAQPVYAKENKTQLVVTALGPVGMVYYARKLLPTERDFVVKALVGMAHVPLVLTVDSDGQLCAWSEAGTYSLPTDNAKIFGVKHPFFAEIATDLIALCRHLDAGDFIICGWRDGVRPCSFAIEKGAHGGFGPEETNAFALLPGDAPLPARTHDFLRPADLRHAAFNVLATPETEITVERRAASTALNTLRIMSYNVHSCIGMDGRLAPERIARIIARYSPDIIALQELDVGRMRTEGVDQAHYIAQRLAMDYHFHPTLHLEEERYGDAILTHLPMRFVKAGVLPGLAHKPRLEPRGALWVAVDIAGIEIQVINTHLGLSARERRLQVEALLGKDWLAHAECREPIILCGDFNALPASPVCRRLRAYLDDAQIALDRHRPKNTFFTRLPLLRIDHVFVDRSFKVLDIEVPYTELTRVASDHIPLIVELEVAQTDKH